MGVFPGDCPVGTSRRQDVQETEKPAAGRGRECPARGAGDPIHADDCFLPRRRNDLFATIREAAVATDGERLLALAIFGAMAGLRLRPPSLGRDGGVAADAERRHRTEGEVAHAGAMNCARATSTRATPDRRRHPGITRPSERKPRTRNSFPVSDRLALGAGRPPPITIPPGSNPGVINRDAGPSAAATSPGPRGPRPSRPG